MFLDRLLGRLASAEDRALLEKPTLRVRMRVLARTTARYFWLYLVLLVASLAWVSASGMDVYHKTESPEFCSGCHEMGINFDTWANSRHHSIRCIDCHAKPGLTGWVAAKAGGVAQLYTHLTAKSINVDEIELKQKHMDIVSDNCGRCHTGATRLTERDGRRIAHDKHAEAGVACIQCHTGRVAHPDAKDAKITFVGLADTDTCFKCHDGKTTFAGTKGPIKVFGTGDETACKNCHPDSIHAQAHFGDKAAGKKPCLDCHEHKDGAQRHYLMDHVNQGKLCGKCHEPNKQTASIHKPYAEGKCDTCHQVMAPGFLFRGQPKANQAFCLSCHGDVAKAIGLAQPATLTNFRDGDSDLHASHAKDASDRGDRLCLSCHDGHASGAAKAMIFLRGVDGGEPGKFEAKPTGGSCTGSCHDDGMSYDRSGGDDEDKDEDEAAKPAAAPAGGDKAKDSDEDEE